MEFILAKVVDLLEGRELEVVLGYDPFPCAAVRDVMLRTEGVEQFLASEAEGSFEGVSTVVYACVDHLAVAGRGFCSDGIVALEEER